MSAIAPTAITIPSTSSVTVAIVDVVTPAGCHSLTSYAPCRTTPDPPSAAPLVCSVTTNSAGYDIPYFSAPSGVYPITVTFDVDIDGPSGPCWHFPVTYTFTGPQALTPCDFEAAIIASCPSYVPPCSSSFIRVIRAVSVSYNACQLPFSCILDLSNPGPGLARPAAGGDAATDLQSASNIQFSVIPNPNKGTFTLTGNLTDKKAAGNVKVEVMDVLGKVVYSDDAVVENGKVNKAIAVDNLASGVYLIHIKSDEINQVVRFTLEH